MSIQPLLSIRHLDVAFNQQGRQSLVADDVCLELFPGQTLAVVGESGSGKSVTAMSILRLLAYPQASHPNGEIIFDGKDLLTLPETQLRRIRGKDIGMIFQEPMTALNPLHTVEKQIGEVLRVHQGLNKQQAKTVIIDWLGKVGIPKPESRLKSYPHELSGGQRQRVMIAMALANNPKILIADEPTTALDVTVQKQILDLIQDLKQESQMAVMLISHDLGVVKRYSDNIAVMQHGKIVEQAPPQRIFESPQHPYTQELISADPKGSPLKKEGNNTLCLSAENLTVKFPLNKPLFRKTNQWLMAVNNLSMQVKAGETLGIIGESGSGKSTLAMALLKLQKSEGAITFEGTSIESLSSQQMRPYRQALQVVFQDPFASLSPRMTIAQIIAEGLVVFKDSLKGSIDDAVDRAMAEVGLDLDMKDRYPHEFSGGQRQRIAIARALVLKPRLIVLDEPTSALDRAVQAQVIDLLRSLQDKYGLSYIFISHDLKVVKALSHDIIVMKDGKIVEHGPANEILEAPKNPYTQALLEAALN